MFPVRSRERTVRNHFKHSVELVDREGEIADVLAAVEDFLLARAMLGGSLTEQNKAIVCEPCNHEKGHFTLREWTRILTRDADPRAAIVAAYRTARKTAQAAEREATV